MAGASAERQETGVINAINNAVESNNKNPINVKAGNVLLSGIISANKFGGRQLSGSEPYTDVVLTTYDNKKINLSLKGTSAPSLAGGGLRGLELAVPGIAAKFLKAAYENLKNKLKPGDKVPDVFGRISDNDKIKIVVGNKQMGGPIDYMYIGPMDVSDTYNEINKLLTLNGNLIRADQYAKTHNLYFRLRARREDQRFDPTAKDKNGIPKIYGVSPSKGDSAGRIVVVDKIPSSGVIVRI